MQDDILKKLTPMEKYVPHCLGSFYENPFKRLDCLMTIFHETDPLNTWELMNYI